MKLTRIANAGILIEDTAMTCLVDAFCSDDVETYFGTDPTAFQRLLNEKGVDYLIFTHSHPDHFSAVMAMQYLSAHPETTVAAPSLVLEKLSLCGIPRSQMLAAEDVPLSCDSPVRAFRTVHIGAPYRDVQHYSFYLKLSLPLVYTGDAIPVSSNYAEFLEQGLSVGVLASNYAHIIGTGIRITRDLLHAEHTAILHLPDPNNDPVGLNDMTKAAVAKERDMDLRILPYLQSLTIQ